MLSQPKKLTSWVAVCFVLAFAANVTFAADAAPARKLNIGGTDQKGATIKGVVKFKGKQVKRRPIQMNTDPHCAAVNRKSPALSETWVFGKNDTLQNVFVWISSGVDATKAPAPKTNAELDQKGCVFVPHISGVVVGQELKFLNSDATLHNISMVSTNNGTFNESMAVKGATFSHKFNKPETGITLQCNVHPWMRGYLHVVEHPYFAVTQEDGTFELRGLPPGTYTVSVWHEFRRFAPDKASVIVTVGENQTKQVTFTYSPVSRKR